MTNLNNWDRWYLHLAKEAADKSKDPNTKVGCFIADEDSRPVSFGFNGMPAGVNDTPERLNDREFKLKATLHAELNAALFANQSLRGCTAYVWPLPPCLHCTGVLIQKKISRIVALCNRESDRYKRWEHHLPDVVAFCQEAGVVLDIEYEEDQQ